MRRPEVSGFSTVMLSAVLLGGVGCNAASAQPPRTIAPVAAPAQAAIFTAAALTPDDASGNPYDYFGGLEYDPGVPSPESWLGWTIGTRFTQHADVIGYVYDVAEASDRVEAAMYGRSHEGRSLHYLTISSPANLARIDEIFAANLELTDPNTSAARAKQIAENNPAIVWFSYNVHGNEASSSEAAMQVVYTMASAQNAEVQEILDNVVLIVDPMINPDGRDRYVNWYRMVQGKQPNKRAEASEHAEPWPGGRTNHYYFDLNRDWLWMVHPESRSRIVLYTTIKPQLHIDYHEQGYRSPYFFGAGEDPYNVNIPAETREWIEMYGGANAEVFDRNGLPYATKERFDYLYPGYGKVMPVYHGAIGMLCEQAGHGFAGLAIDLDGHNTLTLTDRARNHFLTSMSYLETTSANRQGQLERFRRFYTESMTPDDSTGRYFFLKPDNDPAMMQRVWDLCTPHGVQIYELTDAVDVPGLTSYRTGEGMENATLPAGTWVIPAAQPMGRLVRAIFERRTVVTDIETYDISGWSVPISFGMEGAYTVENFDPPTQRVEDWRRPAAEVTGEGDVAVVIDAAQHDFPTAVGLAVKHDIIARRTGDAISIDDVDFSMGSMIVYSTRNRHTDMDAFISDCVDAGITVHRTSSSMTTAGHVLGADDNGHWPMPQVMLLRDSPMSSNSFGQMWHYLDVQYPIPYTAVNIDDLGRAPLEDYNVIVLAQSFGMGRAINGGTLNDLKSWIRGGGTVVAIGSSAQWAHENLVKDDEDKKAEEEEDDRPKPSELTYEEREQRNNEENIPGAMFKATVDTTNPLAAGVGEWTGVMKFGDRTLEFEDDAYIVARFDEEPFVGGYASERNIGRIAGTPFMVDHRVGRGHVIGFSDDVSIRGFMHGPMRLVLNAIIYGPGL
jgi:hypothetical protein